MNRKQKKKLLANKYPEVYGAKQRYTRDQVEAVTTMEVNRVMGNLLASVLLTLRDEHGFGNQRLAKFMDDSFSQMDAISNEYVTAQEILETIEDETGLNYYEYANEIAKKVKV